MSEYSVAEAKNQLSKLIDQALEGKGVVITRHGHPVVELKAVVPPRRLVTPDDVAWIAERRVGRRVDGEEDAGRFVSRMRDEEWER